MTIYDLPEEGVKKFFSKPKNREIYAGMLYYAQIARDYEAAGDEDLAQMSLETSQWLSCYLQFMMFDEILGGTTSVAQATQGLYNTLLEASDEYMKSTEEIYQHYLKVGQVSPVEKPVWMSGYDAGFLDAIANVGGAGFVDFLKKLDDLNNQKGENRDGPS